MKKQPFRLEAHQDPRPDLLVERGPHGRGVGPWVPAVKHTLLAKYIGAAYAAMNRWPQRVFIDPFCGPGRILVSGESDTRDGGSVVAWRQSQSCDAPYTRMLIGDIDPDRLGACRSRLDSLGAPVQAFEGRADDTVRSMVGSVPKSALCLAYLDPYNLSLLSFDMIRALAELPRIDFASISPRWTCCAMSMPNSIRNAPGSTRWLRDGARRCKA